ncbi:MAG: phosphatase PAP2 family protein [Methylacidiphilales bacterium]|nr:phosphatase PAP2 family protein [Candidatus Methylacidiphilales bacterium]
MNPKSLGVLSLLFVILASTCAIADKETKDPQWLSRAQEQTLSDSVPPPPAVGSAEDQADLAKVLEIQKSRTPAMIAECKRDETFSYKLFEDVYGKNLTPDHAPKFNQFLKNVMAITRTINETAKNKYKRLRPYQQHPDQVHALFKVTGYSYPSGHAMGSYTLAVVLGTLLPNKQQALLDRAAQIAQSRVDAGVHNPSDIKEGEVLGRATGNAILASPGFQHDLVAATKELGQ